MKVKKSFLSFLLAIVASFTLASCGQSPTSNSVYSQGGGVQYDEFYVTKIEVTQMPNKTQYVANEEAFDSTGMILKATWNDGYVEENVPSTKYYVEPSGIIPSGTTFVTIIYGDATCKVDITTDGEKELYIKNVPVKTDYTVGEYFEVTGLILGYKLGTTYIDIEGYDISKVTFDRKALTKSDTKVTVTYEGLSIDVPINVRGQSIKIELEDSTQVTTHTSGTAKPGSKLKIGINEDGKYTFGKDTFETREEAIAAAMNSKTTSAATKTQVAQASGGDFLAYLDNNNSGFTVNLKNISSTKYNLFMRGSSNFATTIVNWVPYQMGAMTLNDFMTIEVNGNAIDISDDVILPGCGDGTTGDHSYWTNWVTLDLGAITLNPSLETNTIRFHCSTINAMIDTDEVDKETNEQIKQYKYTYGNGSIGFGQYDYVLLEDIG